MHQAGSAPLRERAARFGLASGSLRGLRRGDHLPAQVAEPQRLREGRARRRVVRRDGRAVGWQAVAGAILILGSRHGIVAEVSRDDLRKSVDTRSFLVILSRRSHRDQGNAARAMHAPSRRTAWCQRVLFAARSVRVSTTIPSCFGGRRRATCSADSTAEKTRRPLVNGANTAAGALAHGSRGGSTAAMGDRLRQRSSDPCRCISPRVVSVAASRDRCTKSMNNMKSDHLIHGAAASTFLFTKRRRPVARRRTG